MKFSEVVLLLHVPPKICLSHLQIPRRHLHSLFFFWFLSWCFLFLIISFILFYHLFSFFFDFLSVPATIFLRQQDPWHPSGKSLFWDGRPTNNKLKSIWFFCWCSPSSTRSSSCLFYFFVSGEEEAFLLSLPLILFLPYPSCITSSYCSSASISIFLSLYHTYFSILSGMLVIHTYLDVINPPYRVFPSTQKTERTLGL